MKRNMMLMACVAMLTACGAAGEAGPAGEAGASGLVETAAEPGGENCEEGGIVVRVGVDEDGDGELSDDEVDDTSYLCNGESGEPGDPGDPGTAGPRSLVEMADATECGEAGGATIRVGVDDNEDGTLQEGEVDSERDVCNSVAGSEGAILIAQSSLAPGGICFAGGTSLDIGRDTDGNGVLDETEIESNLTTCNPCPLGYAEDPADANSCVPAQTIVFEGLIETLYDDGGLAPPIAVGDVFEGKVILYGSVTDSIPDSQMGAYTFSGAPSAFTVEMPGVTLSSSVQGAEILVEINDDFGFTQQDEYRVTSMSNEALGTLVVEALTLELYDPDGAAFVGDGMRVPAADEFEQKQFSVVVSTGQDPAGPGPGPIVGGSSAVASGAVTFLRSY